MSTKTKAPGRKTPTQVRTTPKTKAPGRKAPTRVRTTPKHRTEESGSRSNGLSSSQTSAAGNLGSKQSLLVTRLGQPAGAKIADLTKDLNWLPHTVRAALTRLRQRGYAVIRSKSEEGITIYRATLPATAKKRHRAAAKTAA